MKNKRRRAMATDEIKAAIDTLPDPERQILDFALHNGWVSAGVFHGLEITNDHGRRAAVAIGRLERMGALIREPQPKYRTPGATHDFTLHGAWADALAIIAALLLLVSGCGDDQREFTPCGDLVCTGLACDDTPLCTCELATGDYVTCDPERPPTVVRSVCCDLLPDESAVRRCELEMAPFPPGACGVLVCPLADGSNQRISICGAP